MAAPVVDCPEEGPAKARAVTALYRQPRVRGRGAAGMRLEPLRGMADSNRGTVPAMGQGGLLARARRN